jgi:hypothetical protein
MNNQTDLKIFEENANNLLKIIFNKRNYSEIKEDEGKLTALDNENNLVYANCNLIQKLDKTNVQAYINLIKNINCDHLILYYLSVTPSALK